MRKCDLTMATVFHCSFLGADMVGVDARRATFANCKFTRCDMRSWKAEGTSFINCEFELCDMGGWFYDSQTVIRRDSGAVRGQTALQAKEKGQRILPTCVWGSDWRQSEESVKLVGPRDAMLVFQS